MNHGNDTCCCLCVDPKSPEFGAVFGYCHEEGPEQTHLIVPPGALLEFMEIAIDHYEKDHHWKDDKFVPNYKEFDEYD